MTRADRLAFLALVLVLFAYGFAIAALAALVVLAATPTLGLR